MIKLVTECQTFIQNFTLRDIHRRQLEHFSHYIYMYVLTIARTTFLVYVANIIYFGLNNDLVFSADEVKETVFKLNLYV